MADAEGAREMLTLLLNNRAIEHPVPIYGFRYTCILEKARQVLFQFGTVNSSAVLKLCSPYHHEQVLF